ncbi:hypothetical protein [Paenibacillus senegalensis]|uniref:hypothetical protein n=1 Tax=Paenibacillus senegalensis TaxID=1465766 RepID=UPI000289E773|nr:hypothetical protein [Paenibacillus senegalensis]
MTKQLIVILGTLLFLTSCSSTESSKEQSDRVQPIPPATTSGEDKLAGSPAIKDSISETEDNKTNELSSNEENMEELPELEIDNIEVTNVEEELLEVMMAYLHAAKAQNQLEVEKLFHPEALKSHLHGFYRDGPSRSVVSIYPNPDHREKDVAEEYGFDPDNVRIIVVDCGEAGSLNFILVREEGEWLLYRTD